MMKINEADIYEKVKIRYKKRKTISIILMTAACIAAVLTVIFIFVDTVGTTPEWNQYHYWATGLTAVLVVTGAIMFVSAQSALKDIEKAVDRLNPDEREQVIQEKAKAKTHRIYMLLIYPVVFVTASVLLMLNQINFVAWILLVVNYLAVAITAAIIRKKEYDKY